jgi:hypothetical protein
MFGMINMRDVEWRAVAGCGFPSFKHDGGNGKWESSILDLISRF